MFIDYCYSYYHSNKNINYNYKAISNHNIIDDKIKYMSYVLFLRIKLPQVIKVVECLFEPIQQPLFFKKILLFKTKSRLNRN